MRLEEDGGGLAGRRLLDRLDVVERHADEAFEQRRERRAVLLVAGGGDGGHRAAVEGVLGDDDLVGAVAVLFAPLARDLDEALDGLGAAVAEEDLVEAGAVAEELRRA